MRAIQYAAPSRPISKTSEYLYGGGQEQRLLGGRHVYLLVRRRVCISSSRPQGDRRLGGATVKGGRRPSRSDAALDGREPGDRLEVGTRRCSWRREDDFRGEPALDAISRRRLVFGWSIGTSTMMHACASGGEAPGRRVHSGSRRKGHVFHRITATSDVVGRLLGCQTVN